MSHVQHPSLSIARTTPLTAAARFPFAVLLPIIVLAALGAAVGYQRSPVYTAESRVSVTRLDVQTQALPGYAQAARSLASAYSRNVGGTAVQECVARRTGQSPAYVAKLVGTPIADSPVIRVIAQGPNGAAATRIADAGATCLVRDVGSTGAPDRSGPALREYREASRKAAGLQRRVNRLKAPDSTVSDRRRDDLEADLAEQRLVVQSLGQRYTSETVNQQQVENISVLAKAVRPTNDRMSKVAILAFSGAIVGLVLGLMLASLRLRRRLRAADAPPQH
jgi:capsular polysaccharide biosynthesis protein